MQDAKVWRRWLLALCAAGLLQLALIPWGTYNLDGDLVGGYGAVDAIVTTGSLTDRFGNVRPGTPAERAGIRAGDSVDLRALSAADRYRWRTNSLQGPIGFVLNRAAVFTAVSLAVVGLFTLAEWALGGWLHSANRITNVAVSAALSLGLSLHQIHSRVDRVVDNVFLRKRHEDQRALMHSPGRRRLSPTRKRSWNEHQKRSKNMPMRPA